MTASTAVRADKHRWIF